MPDALLVKVKQVARQRGTTLRELVIEGLHAVLDKRSRAPGFRLRDAAFGKNGLVDGLEETDWDTIRELSYKGRGG